MARTEPQCCFRRRDTPSGKQRHGMRVRRTVAFCQQPQQRNNHLTWRQLRASDGDDRLLNRKSVGV